LAPDSTTPKSLPRNSVQLALAVANMDVARRLTLSFGGHHALDADARSHYSPWVQNFLLAFHSCFPSNRFDSEFYSPSSDCSK
jgi:hypothetical protein